MPATLPAAPLRLRSGMPGAQSAVETPQLLAFQRPAPSFVYEKEAEPADGCWRLITPEEAIGRDTRQKIVATEALPYRQIGQLLIEVSDGYTYIGTGTLVGPRHVLTAAHNLYHIKDKSSAVRVTFVPGRRGNETAFPNLWCRSVEFRVPREYGEGDIRHDYAMVILPPEVAPAMTSQLGTMAVGAFVPSALRDREVVIAGYAEDKDQNYGRFLYADRNQIERVDATYLWYYVDTGRGQSGSPIYVEQDGGFILAGIHTCYDGTYNRGIHINEANFQVISAWIEGAP